MVDAIFLFPPSYLCDVEQYEATTPNLKVIGWPINVEIIL